MQTPNPILRPLAVALAFAAGPVAAPAQGPGANLIAAEIASPPTSCESDGGVTSCSLSFTLENPSGSPIYWTGGEVTTAPPDGSAPVPKPIIYGANTLGPGDIKILMSVCRVPKGQEKGTWEASGTGHFPGNTDLEEFTWKLETTCP